MSALLLNSEESLSMRARSSGTCVIERQHLLHSASLTKLSVTYFAHALITLNQAMHSLDCQKAVIDRHMLLASMNDVRRDDGREVVNVHFTATLFVHMGE